MNNKIDLLLISPSNPKATYQGLSKKYSAIEPPTWALLLAQSVRAKSFKVALLDCLAEDLSYEQVQNRIELLNPKIILFVVYGQNVNSGTTSMSGAISLSNFLKDKNIKQPIVYVGSHVQALPVDTLLSERSIDIILTNEGVYALHNLMRLNTFDQDTLVNIKGLCFRLDGKPFMTLPEKIVPQNLLEEDLPGYAYDLLPKNKKEFDLYRSPLWHAEYNEDFRSPYAAIQTSLGCQFGCSFCMINIINRNDNQEIGVASNYSGMRHWSIDFIIKEFDKLISKGVYTIKIVDEMFLLNPKFYKPLCEELVKRNKEDKLKMWAYSRIDTVKNLDTLNLLRKAGIKWLCLGIESGRKNIRLEVSKGKFEEVDIKKVVDHIHQAGIEVMANYIYGLPGDDVDSINETFDLSKELCTSGWNTYTAIPLPGSQLYSEAKNKGQKLPSSYEAYSFHSYHTEPMPTEKLSGADLLKLRDKAFIDYHTAPKFLERIENKFGVIAKENIINMTQIKLKRKLIEEQEYTQLKET
jgi:radical SAM superfamily enzyme YgiQ (UPF0313 family)